VAEWEQAVCAGFVPLGATKTATLLLCRVALAAGAVAKVIGIPVRTEPANPCGGCP
jgi:hypothetical protein